MYPEPTALCGAPARRIPATNPRIYVCDTHYDDTLTTIRNTTTAPTTNPTTLTPELAHALGLPDIPRGWCTIAAAAHAINRPVRQLTSAIARANQGQGGFPPGHVGTDCRRYLPVIDLDMWAASNAQKPTTA